MFDSQETISPPSQPETADGISENEDMTEIIGVQFRSSGQVYYFDPSGYEVAEGVPVIVAYPGRFDGQTLSLFGRLTDGNYYRAFDLI